MLKIKTALSSLFFIAVILTSLHCSSTQKTVAVKKEIYSTSKLIITQLSANSFQHISFLQTNDFGNVPCNGLIVRNGNEAIVFDTPTNDSASEELINWVKATLHCRINAIIPTHFHNDCLGGLNIFHKQNIPSYACYKTIELAKQNKYTLPQNGFRDSLVLNAGTETIIAKFFGEGHTSDNIVGYFPREQVLFGGCLIKELNAGKGYLGDANTATWSSTVEEIKSAYPGIKVVVPGHGESGNKKLLDYTIRLFRTN